MPSLQLIISMHYFLLLLKLSSLPPLLLITFKLSPAEHCFSNRIQLNSLGKQLGAITEMRLHFVPQRGRMPSQISGLTFRREFAGK